jgi:hypothetical protein
MGRTKPTDYSKLVIYKIKCNDESVLDFYVGSTTNFRSRKCAHKSNCETSKQKLYEMIRANGGWINWTMVELELYPCNSSIEARIREEYWRESLQSSLNQRRAYRSEEAQVEYDTQYKVQYYQEHKEEINVKCAIYRQEHYDEIKAKKAQYYQEHTDKCKAVTAKYRQEHYDEIKAKKAQKFECVCGTICRISDKARHKLSQTHQNFLIK